ncbi:hypothetical protein CspeluHIS016_0210870 [Cutaneotrichosporon spelunceum]|uniref:Uncharacterized protein n=1 Tax=Cutaneotrichosporon spelunceum TaxID=1672016 RepID=A0AAD3YAJ2_9TREE|nr:hypothetical protein CspeluHIS016_0210870 [Cutaneotrichosporon spelunceum]
MGRGRLASRDADAEHILTTLFVADEAANADMPKPPRGWGKVLLSKVVSATVVGAAVGLTAYRIWTGGWGSIVQEQPEPPPPGDGREPPEPPDPSETSEPLPPLPFPTSPRSAKRSYAASTGSSPRRHRSPSVRRRPKRPSIAELLTVTEPMTPVSDEDSYLASGQSSATDMAEGPASHTSTLRLDPIFGSDASDTDDETNARLAAMAHRVQGLIAEGQAALSSPSPTSTPRRQTPFPPAPRDKLTPLKVPLEIPPRREGERERVSGWDTDTTEEPRSRSIGYGPPPRPPSRPVSVASMGSVPGSFPRSASASSNSSRYQPVVLPLPWRRESVGATSRWVQKQHSPNNSVGSKNEVPLVLARASPVASTHARQSPLPESRIPQLLRGPLSPCPDSAPGPLSPRSPRSPQSPQSAQSPPRPDSASRIPRPGAHSRASSVASGADAGSPRARRERERDTPSRQSLDRAGWNSPVPPQGLVAARTSLFSSVAESNNTNRSKIPIRRSMGSISSITAVQSSKT